MRQRGWPSSSERCHASCDWRCESSTYSQKYWFSSNCSKIDLSSLTYSVPSIIKELEAVDSGQYPWFYIAWPPKESIGRTDCFAASALSDISEEMIKSWFFWVFPSHDVFTLFFRNHFLSFLLPFFFLFKVQSKIGVHIIRGLALYTGKYDSPFSSQDDMLSSKKLSLFITGRPTRYR